MPSRSNWLFGSNLWGRNTPALPHGVRPRYRPAVDRMLVNTLQSRRPVSCTRPVGWGSLQRLGGSACHSPLSRRTGWASELTIYVSISGEGYCYLTQKGNPRSTCVDTNWLNYYTVLSAFLSKSHRCQMKGRGCKFVLRYLWLGQPFTSFWGQIFKKLLSSSKTGEPGISKGLEVPQISAPRIWVSLQMNK